MAIHYTVYGNKAYQRRELTGYKPQENSELGPVRFSEYAETKSAGDLIVWDLHRREGLPLVVIYPGGVLGSRSTCRLKVNSET